MLHDLKYTVGLAPQVVATSDTAIASAIIDCQGCSEMEFVILTGTLSDVDATFATTLEHGDASNLSDTAAVPDSDMVGTLEAGASFLFSDDSAVKKLGYKVRKRYAKLTITPTGNTGNVPISILALGYPLRQPA